VPPNKKLRDALDKIVIKELDEPSVFPFRHNGITLAAEKVTLMDGRLRLHVPRLLNGAQTVSSTARFIEKNSDNPLLKQNRNRLESILVIAKVIMDDPASDFVTQVTISNN
jgi:AIPR protein